MAGNSFKQSLNHTVRTILALTVPSAILLSIGIEPLIGILGFDITGTRLVVWTVRAYMAGLIGHSLLEVAVRAFYARQKAVTDLQHRHPAVGIDAEKFRCPRLPLQDINLHGLEIFPQLREQQPDLLAIAESPEFVEFIHRWPVRSLVLKLPWAPTQI